jgi:hypothetical protein
VNGLPINEEIEKQIAEADARLLAMIQASETNGTRDTQVFSGTEALQMACDTWAAREVVWLKEKEMLEARLDANRVEIDTLLKGRCHHVDACSEGFDEKTEAYEKRLAATESQTTIQTVMNRNAELTALAATYRDALKCHSSSCIICPDHRCGTCLPCKALALTALAAVLRVEALNRLEAACRNCISQLSPAINAAIADLNQWNEPRIDESK